MAKFRFQAHIFVKRHNGDMHIVRRAFAGNLVIQGGNEIPGGLFQLAQLLPAHRAGHIQHQRDFRIAASGGSSRNHRDIKLVDSDKRQEIGAHLCAHAHFELELFPAQLHLRVLQLHKGFQAFSQGRLKMPVEPRFQPFVVHMDSVAPMRQRRQYGAVGR
jgi:hypothetical protein